jgi:general secretion pathway protein I
MKARRGARGFTFLEVIVALAIFAVTGVVLASAYLNVLGAQQAALQRDTRAADLRLVRQALCTEASLDKVTAWNDLPLPDDRTARWRATVTATNIADLFDVALEINVSGEDGRSQPAVTENLRLLRPTWSVPAESQALRGKARTNLAKRVFQ